MICFYDTVGAGGQFSIIRGPVQSFFIGLSRFQDDQLQCPVLLSVNIAPGFLLEGLEKIAAAELDFGIAAVVQGNPGARFCQGIFCYLQCDGGVCSRVFFLSAGRRQSCPKEQKKRW